jgi:hypothetical protein
MTPEDMLAEGYDLEDVYWEQRQKESRVIKLIKALMEESDED